MNYYNAKDRNPNFRFVPVQESQREVDKPQGDVFVKLLKNAFPFLEVDEIWNVGTSHNSPIISEYKGTLSIKGGGVAAVTIAGENVFFEFRNHGSNPDLEKIIETLDSLPFCPIEQQTI